MNLIENWRAVMRHAWSIRLMLLAVLMEAVSAVLPMLPNHSLMWTLVCNLAAGLLISAAFFARIFAQKEFQHAAD